MMRRETLLPLLLLGLALGQATTVQSAQPASTTDGRFHLIYLVSAVDLKPGSKVYVDPIFFTDGKEVKNFHDHCKPEKCTLQPAQIVGDLKFIEDYCAKKTFTFDPKGYQTLNNHGQRITLDKIDFHIGDARGINNETVMMGYSKLASFTPGSITPPKMLRNDGAPEYFFLMAEDESIFRRFVPVAKATQKEIDALITSGKTAVEKFKGTRVVRDRREEMATVVPAMFDSSLPPSLTNPLMVDIDGDSRLDLIQGAHVSYRSTSDATAPTASWLAVQYTLGSGVVQFGKYADVILRGRYDPWNISGDAYDRFVRNSYPVYTPMVGVRVRECGYVIRYVVDIAMHVPPGIELESVSFSSWWYKKSTEPKKQEECPDIVLTKLIPAS